MIYFRFKFSKKDLLHLNTDWSCSLFPWNFYRSTFLLINPNISRVTWGHSPCFIVQILTKYFKCLIIDWICYQWLARNEFIWVQMLKIMALTRFISHLFPVNTSDSSKSSIYKKYQKSLSYIFRFYLKLYSILLYIKIIIILLPV